VISEDQLTSDLLKCTVLGIMENGAVRLSMSRASRTLGRPDASDRIAVRVLRMSRGEDKP